MPALGQRPARLRGAVTAAILASGAGVACRPHPSPSQCDQLIERYALLVVTAKFPDASAEQIQSERDREKIEARGDDAFKSCSSQVSPPEYDCAMAAATADAFEKCLE